MPFVQRAEQKIYYQQSGQGPAVILIHDFIEDGLFWSKIEKQLSEKFQVITFDLRGIARSSASKKEFKIEDLAEDVIAIADELKIEQFHLVGDSSGGIIAQLVARKFNKRVLRLVLSNSYTHLTQVNRWSLELSLEIFKSNKDYPQFYKLLMPWIFSSRYLEREDDPKELIDDLKSRTSKFSPKAFESLLNLFKNYDSTKNLKYIKAETLVIIAEEDIFCLFRDSRAMIKAIPNHQVELMSGGHNSKLEHPNRFIEVVRDFFLED